MNSHKLVVSVLLILSLSLFVTACGGSGGNAANPPSTSIKVTLKDFYFDPKTFTIPAGQMISITAVNKSLQHVHSFVIMRKGKPVQSSWRDQTDLPNVYYFMDSLGPGQTFTGSFKAPSDPGEYQIVCQVPGHYEAGMVGKLIVVNP